MVMEQVDRMVRGGNVAFPDVVVGVLVGMGLVERRQRRMPVVVAHVLGRGCGGGAKGEGKEGETTGMSVRSQSEQAM